MLLFGCNGPGAKQSLAHFWDGYDFSSQKGLDPIDAAEDRFAEYVKLLEKVDTATAAASIRDFMDRATADTVSYLVYSDLFMAAFYSHQSPFQNTELLRIYLRKAIDQGLVEDYQRFDEADVLRKSWLNLPGSIAEDGQMHIVDGRDVSVLDLAAESSRTRLMLVGQAGCRSCAEVMREMGEKIPRRVRLVAVVQHSWRGEAEWLREELQERWIVAVAGDSFLENYDFNLAPVSYILNRKGKILSME